MIARPLALLLALAALAACGVDGPPEPPAPRPAMPEEAATAPGIIAGGSASIGVRGGS